MFFPGRLYVGSQGTPLTDFGLRVGRQKRMFNIGHIGPLLDVLWEGET